MNEYVPIDCDQHSQLELLAMRRTRVLARAERQNGVGSIEAEGEVQDVRTADGGEYLLLRDRRGGLLAIRLDRLLGLTAPDGRELWCQKAVVREYPY